VGGAIVLFLYNAELLLNLFARVLGRAGRLLPITRIAIAYPMAAKGRTATTLAMFSLVTFTLVGTATITNTFGNFLDTESGSGGYEVLAQSNPFNPISPGAFAAQIAELTAGGEMAEPTALAAAVFAPVQAQSATMSRPANYVINGVDDAFFVTHRLELAGAARGFASAEAVWAAVQADPTLVVIDNFSVDRTGDPTYQRDEEAFIVASIRAGDATFEPTPITLIGSDGAPRQFTVIGVLGTAPSFYGALMNAQAAAGLGHMSPNRYFLRLPAGADARAAANAIESAFGRSGLQTTLLKEQLADSRRSVTSIFYLIQGFVGLGLLIGISALGVITIRSVVERRQHIGVLRAIGFQREMVQAVFMIENLFVGGLASIIGYALALAFSYNLYLQVAADQGLPFAPPWPILIGIGVGIFAAALATAWLHSRRSARVVIAEALRYQG
jgi:putative ABC transport system permease protein